MIDLSPVVALMSPKPAGFTGQWLRSVGSAAQFARLGERAMLPKPIAWVVRAADQVQHAGPREEHTTFVFDVVLSVSNVRGVLDADGDLMALRRAVKNVLLGSRFYHPEIDCEVRAMQWSGGQVIEYTDVDLFWRDRYSFKALITHYLPDPTTPFDPSSIDALLQKPSPFYPLPNPMFARGPL